MEIVAHGDGAVFTRHIDTLTGEGRAIDADRAITAVYYFHDEPKAFSGGLLRLRPLPRVDDGHATGAIDIDPEQDTLVAFSSWTPHEVLEVHCASRRFMDSRFAINCWVLRERGA